MYILYIDHSGEVANSKETYFVMAGVAVFERQIYHLTQELDRIQKDYLPSIPGQVEFHASPIRNHKKPPWDSMTREARESLMIEVYQAIAKAHRIGICLFGQAIEKSFIVPNFSTLILNALQKRNEAEDLLGKARGEDIAKAKEELTKAEENVQNLIKPIISRGFEGLCTQFEYFLRRFHDDSDPNRDQRGLMVFDHASYEKDLKFLMEQFHSYGTRFTSIYNIVEAPFCVDSASTRLLQVADFVSYAMYRRYETGDARYIDLINHRFDELDGVCHGLAHATSNSTCMCPACLSRRVAKKRL